MTARGTHCVKPAGDVRARLRLSVRGAVQGVGFRPLVYRLATELGLPGWVSNDARGLLIEVEGSDGLLRRFIERLCAEKPPQSIIHELTSEWCAPEGCERFEIRQSAEGGRKSAPVLPDLATCPECLAEVLDPAHRQFRYPFTNCTRCGPRFTILDGLPYDRPNTTMRSFAMCSSCRGEYGDPLDRRFHAQPTACPDCGPRLAFWERSADREGWHETAAGDEALLATAAAIRAGRIAAVKGLGGFHLIVDAGNAEAVAALRARKRRPAKPLALMVADVAAARKLCICTAGEEALLASPEAPIVLLLRRAPQDDPGATVADAVAPGNPGLGLMLPATPLHHLLTAELGRPIVATSGNFSEEPICTDETEALERLSGIADVFLVHNRPIVRPMDDSIVRHIAGAPRVLRRARGYAPLPILLAGQMPPILAVGGHLKNTIALGIGRQVFVSQHVGDLGTPQAFATFERMIEDFLRLYDVSPVAIACDLHPDYGSTRWAQEAVARFSDGCRLIAVQHHHAHFAACLAENGADGPALGIIWDGAGYGPDGTIWGGEALVGDPGRMRRAAHLRPFRLPGGEMATRQPRRTALALLYDTFGDVVFGWDDLAPVASFARSERPIVASMLRRGFNAPLTTSAGRLFDGVAALAGLRQRTGYEGEAAMALEFAADPTVTDAYPLAIEPGDVLVIDWRPIIEGVVGDVRRGRDVSVIAARFHNSLVESMLGVAQVVGQPRVALSGGCFQNKLLVEGAIRRLEPAGFAVLLHSAVPPNDGGVSLGQIAVAAALLAHKEF